MGQATRGLVGWQQQLALKSESSKAAMLKGKKVGEMDQDELAKLVARHVVDALRAHGVLKAG